MNIDPALYPFEHHYLDRNGLRYHYVDEGRGLPVVMLHGNPTWSFYYRNLVQELSSDHRTIVPDHIGCGFSDKPGDDRYEYTLNSRVDDLEALLDHLGIHRDITLVLHDWGGMIGMAFATRYPERIRRLVVLNTSAFLLPPKKAFPAALWLVRNTPLGPLLVRGFNAFSWTAAQICCKRRPLSRVLKKAYTAPYRNWADRIATLRFVQDIPLAPGDPAYAICEDVERNAAQFRDRPMLICWGEKDFVFSTEFLDRWTETFPQAEVHRWPDGGHYILEDASDEILKLVRQFLAEHPLEVAAAS
ncbi:alpha/beta fold hydrolase [Acanthopleuribacter pedis]|uniref:Alpha/beta fold hydrolase n=1 Tax=Acanthopleuribacter pedis TaxID=442870 RepID=A0A8J7U2H3_9BACT|nr:alpha/beta fold hydrolase [Acanthopleuribacter pedis]MBO1317248.1 alpha/beta fold hydrolase [Acanthopleuribacter pedis]MBO1318555.1 alpha/beta fold hydrolase [Acanthopleuribacter pedis]